jgi:hypothetical protein
MAARRQPSLNLAGSSGRPCASRSSRPQPHTKNMEYSGWGWSWATMARPVAMVAATMPSMRSVVLGGLEVADGILGDGDVGGHLAMLVAC